MRVGWLVSVLLLVPLAGCLSDSDVSDLGVEALSDGSLSTAPVTSYLHDLSEPIPGVSIDTAILEQFRIDGPDGFVLDTWLLRPDMEGPLPTVIEVTPYYGGGPIRLENGAHWLGRVGEELVSRGFAVGISSVRGTGNSEGCFTIGGASEAKDTAAMIEWIAEQEWSNGNVGLMGVSYPGTTPQDVWVEAPPSLKTIVPISGISDLYKYNFVNGVPIYIQGFGFNTYYWAMVGASPAGLSGGAQALDPVGVPGAVIGEACTEQVDVQEGGVSSTLDGNKDAYWQERDFLAELQASLAEDPDKERASVFYIHGLQDWNVKPDHMQDWLPAIQETGVPFKAWLGQWGHAWPQPTSGECTESYGRDGSCRNDWWTQTMVAWFDQFLLDKDTGVLDAPAVQVQDDQGVWRHEANWPPTDAMTHQYFLDDDSVLSSTKGQGESTYHDNFGGWDAGALYAQEPVSAEWVSEPVKQDLHISGQPEFTATVTAEGQRASLILTLMEQLPSGERRSINFAAQSLNHVESLEAGNPDISGKAQEVSVRFFPQDDVIREGSRIVLVAAGNTQGSPSPALQPVSDGGHITIDHAGAKLSLPVDHSIVVESPQPYKGA